MIQLHFINNSQILSACACKTDFQTKPKMTTPKKMKKIETKNEDAKKGRQKMIAIDEKDAKPKSAAIVRDAEEDEINSISNSNFKSIKLHKKRKRKKKKEEKKF